MRDDRQRVAVLPILAGGPLAVLLAEAVIHIVIGLVIAVLVAIAAGSALLRLRSGPATGPTGSPP